MVLPHVVMHFSRTAAQQADLDNLLQQQHDPSSPNYHKWLQPEQFADRFGVTSADLAQVTTWLESRGFTVVEKSRSRTYVAFSGSVGLVDSVFRTDMRHYLVGGEEHFANSVEPVVPAALSSIVLGFRGLHDFHPRPHGIILRSRLTSYITGNHFLAPDDFATIFNIQPLRRLGIDGTGVTIAVIGQTNITLSDVRTFRRNAGLIASDPQVILAAGTDPGIVTGEIGEANLDLDWTGAVAPGASLVYVFANRNAGGAFQALFHIVDQNLAPVISSSYGNCEKNFSATDLSTMTDVGQQANSQGITITSSSGDSGASDCDTTSPATQGLSVDMPATLPTVTAIGGTTLSDGGGTFGTTFWNAANDILNGSALSYIPEVAWNDAGVDGATGGGAAINFSKPTWQTGTGVPNDGKRDVPDVSFPASPAHAGYIICSQGSCTDGFRAADTTFNIVGGTSAGSPAFAGVIALINQYTGSAQGNVNPRLYQLAALSSDVFHDVTSGDNKVTCQSGTANCTTGTMGFSAGPGYDQVTGLGSVDVTKLVTEWVPVAITPASLAFGNRLPNTSTTMPVTVRNNNSAVLNISGISITGGFSQTNNCPGALSFGATCTIQIRLVSAAAGAQSGSLTISADDSPNPHVVPLSATFTDLPIALARTARVVRSSTNVAPATSTAQPAPTATSDTTPSGARLATGASATARRLTIARIGSADIFTVSNRQTVPLSISIAVPPGFQQDNDCGDELKSKLTCSVRIRRERAEATGELTITSGAEVTTVPLGVSEQ